MTYADDVDPPTPDEIEGWADAADQDTRFEMGMYGPAAEVAAPRLGILDSVACRSCGSEYLPRAYPADRGRCGDCDRMTPGESLYADHTGRRFDGDPA